MIVGDLKPIEEIETAIDGRERVLVLGCRGCVTVCNSGGEKEVAVLASELRIAGRVNKKKREIDEANIERQCDFEYIEPIRDQIRKAQVVVSLACGAGVQHVAEVAAELDPPVQVVPGLNTTFLGAAIEEGVWAERCQGCGNCVLEITGGICPIARCSKSLLNGPCGGSSDGKCEINPDVDCAWQLIYDRLSRLGKLENIERVIPARDWSTSRDGGPRKRVREDLRR
ncbi:MAG TPA: methylenetetrahydrofolate reductase C-terminal domain-containing protein [Myxococcota bacterium]|nr:methylenetetrahydrofolate reductase C-terminal domain-containing protein [Myxococcota bacterium]